MRFLNFKRVKAFTLAEVLITLSIIGVVAALTIPSLINNVDKAQFVTALQKNYAVLQQAFLMLKTENGGSIVSVFQADTTTNSGDGTALNAFLTKLNYAKNCANATGCLYDSPRYLLDKTPGPATLDSAWDGKFEKAVLSNGAILILQVTSTDCTGGSNKICGNVSVDVNGQKGPNTVGRDLHSFTITQDGIYPSGIYDGYSCGAGNNIETSSGCTLKVLQEGKMDY